MLLQKEVFTWRQRGKQKQDWRKEYKCYCNCTRSLIKFNGKSSICIGLGYKGLYRINMFPSCRTSFSSPSLLPNFSIPFILEMVPQATA